MNLPSTENRNFWFFIIPISLVYIILTLVSVNHCYFWDNIQQISKEAHWFYLTDFKSLLMPAPNSGSEIVATGYHPPLMGIMTAALWKIFGYELWVSHVFVFFWFGVLIYNSWKVIYRFLDPGIAGWILAIALLESTLLSQFSVASPDFILFTSFVLSLRAILERKYVLLAIGIFFLCTINMRGIFAGAILFISQLYFENTKSKEKTKIRDYTKMTIPYLPTLVVLSSYFAFYFLTRGWFFANSSTEGHYALPNSFFRIAKHFSEFGLRSVENGRIIIWLAGIIFGYFMWKNKLKLSDEKKFLLAVFVLLTGLYTLFIFITQMPFSARYFMPQFFILTILATSGMATFLKKQTLKYAFILIIFFEITGNFWIYPDKIAKSWDCTLAHLPYYKLRNQCFKYIDEKNISYNDLSAGFCLYGNRKFIELSENSKTVNSDTNRKYFIYSNISNLEDNFAEELNDKSKWMPIKRFEEGFVKIIVYERIFVSTFPKHEK